MKTKRLPHSGQYLSQPDRHGVRVCAFAFGDVEAGVEDVFARPHVEASARMCRTRDAPCLVGHDDYARCVEDADLSGQCIECAEHDAIRVVQCSLRLGQQQGADAVAILDSFDFTRIGCFELGISVTNRRSQLLNAADALSGASSGLVDPGASMISPAIVARPARPGRCWYR